MESLNLKELLEYLAKALVDDVENVSVNEKIGDRTTVFELTVTKKDIGKIIGKQGRTAESIRTILNGAGAKLHKRCILEIIE